MPTMSQVLYKTRSVIKYIPLTAMPDYAPTSPAWNATLINYNLADHSTEENPVYESRSKFTPQLERALKMIKGDDYTPIFTESPSRDDTSTSQARTRYKTIPHEVLAIFINYTNEKLGLTRADAKKKANNGGSNSTSSGLDKTKGKCRVEKGQKSKKSRVPFELNSLRYSYANADVKKDAANATANLETKPTVQEKAAQEDIMSSVYKGVSDMLSNPEMLTKYQKGLADALADADAELGDFAPFSNTVDLVIRKKKGTTRYQKGLTDALADADAELGDFAPFSNTVDLVIRKNKRT